MKRIYCYDKDFLSVLFPEYRFIDQSVYLPPKTFYIGRDEVQGDEDSYRLVYSINRQVNISLPDRYSIVRMAYNRKGINKVPVTLEKHIDKITKDVFRKELNMFMATGKWIRISDIEGSVYKLFQALLESKREFLKVYFNLRDKKSFNVIWSSMLTFFLRVLNFDYNDGSLNEEYKKIISRFNSQSDKIKSLVKILYSNHYDEMTVLNFLLDVR